MTVQPPLPFFAIDRLDAAVQRPLLPLYIRNQEAGEKILTLCKTETPLCLDTADRLQALQAVIMIFDTEAEAQVFKRALSSVMTETMETKDIRRAGACLMALSAGVPSIAFRNLLATCQRHASCGDAVIGIKDQREYRAGSEVAFSFDFCHRSLREMTMAQEALHKDPDGASEALFMLVERDLADDTVLRFFQDKISHLEGACIPVISVSAEDIREQFEDEADEDEVDVDFWASLKYCLGTPDIISHLAGVRQMIITRATDVSLGGVEFVSEPISA